MTNDDDDDVAFSSAVVSVLEEDDNLTYMQLFNPETCDIMLVVYNALAEHFVYLRSTPRPLFSYIFEQILYMRTVRAIDHVKDTWRDLELRNPWDQVYTSRAALERLIPVLAAKISHFVIDNLVRIAGMPNPFRLVSFREQAPQQTNFAQDYNAMSPRPDRVIDSTMWRNAVARRRRAQPAARRRQQFVD